MEATLSNLVKQKMSLPMAGWGWNEIFKVPSNPKPPRIVRKVEKENVQATRMSHEFCKAVAVNTWRTNNCIFFKAELLLQLAKKKSPIDNPKPSENNAMHINIHVYLRCERQGRKQKQT